MFRIILFTAVFIGSLSANAFDTTKVLRYTEALSHKMDFPSVFKRFNGEFRYSDEEMAFFKMKSIKENYVEILKEGGMNDHLYTFKIFDSKKGKFITAINLRSGSDGRCMIKCFEVTEEKDELFLEDAPKRLHDTKFEDLGIDAETAEKMRANSNLFYLAFTFEDLTKIKVEICLNPPFGKENQAIIEDVLNAYPGLDKKVMYLNWNRKKGKFEKA